MGFNSAFKGLMTVCPKGQTVTTLITSSGSTYPTTLYQISKYIQEFCAHFCNQKEKGLYLFLKKSKETTANYLAFFYEQALKLSV